MRKSWTFDSAAFQRLQELVAIAAPSMDEVALASWLRRCWTVDGLSVSTDVMGNVHASVNEEAAVHVGLVAHMDTVALQVTKKLGNGLFNFRSIGLRPHTLLGQPVKVLTSNGMVDGVVGFDPTSQYGQPKGLIEQDLWLDAGYEADSKVSVGDLAVLAPRLVEMGDGLVCGTGIDDRIGILILCEIMSLVGRECPNVCLHFIGTVQEEVGLRGASIVAAQHPLDACFVLDVDYATDTPASHENDMGVLHLGKGVGLHAKSDNNPVLRKLLCNVADTEGIPYQISLGRFLYGGTDSAPLQLQQKGIATANVNIPCRYMHSPVEICDRRDVEAAVNLLAAVIREIDRTGKSGFIPGLD